jgi:C-terminal processing protease CtpA/Prc
MTLVIEYKQTRKTLPTFIIGAVVGLALAGCTTQPTTRGPSPTATPRVETDTRPATPSPAPPPPQVATPEVVEKSLDSILSDYTKKWRQDYPLRQKLAAKCPASKGYSYGMRMLQPATFQGEFADAVKRKYGNTTDFIVIAVAPGSAASKIGIATGDRLVQVGNVKSTQANAGKTLGEQSRKWANPYDVVVMRAGQPVTMQLKPDQLCEIPL